MTFPEQIAAGCTATKTPEITGRQTEVIGTRGRFDFVQRIVNPSAKIEISIEVPEGENLTSVVQALVTCFENLGIRVNQ